MTDNLTPFKMPKVDATPSPNATTDPWPLTRVLGKIRDLYALKPLSVSVLEMIADDYLTDARYRKGGGK